MMKNKDQYAVAVRTPENEIVVEKKEYHSFMETHKWAQLPLIRGGVAFAESMSVGIQVLSYSASFYEEDEEQQKTSKVEQAFSNVFKGKTETVIMALTVVLAIILAIGIFMVLPWFVAEQAGKIIENHIGSSRRPVAFGDFCCICVLYFFDQRYKACLYVSWGGT